MISLNSVNSRHQWSLRVACWSPSCHITQSNAFHQLVNGITVQPALSYRPNQMITNYTNWKGKVALSCISMPSKLNFEQISIRWWISENMQFPTTQSNTIIWRHIQTLLYISTKNKISYTLKLGQKELEFGVLENLWTFASSLRMSWSENKLFFLIPIPHPNQLQKTNSQI